MKTSPGRRERRSLAKTNRTKDSRKKQAINERKLLRLREQLVEGLSGLLRVETQQDPYQRATIVRCTVRIVPPGHRF